jgi:hypothetical protein
LHKTPVVSFAVACLLYHPDMFLFNLPHLYVNVHGFVYSLEEAAPVGVFEESFGDLAWASLSSDSSSLGGRLLSMPFARLLVI